MDRFSLSSVSALKLSSQFQGCGPNLYLMTRSGWVALLGNNEQRGEGMYVWLRIMRREEGAVPRGVEIGGSS
jgi:hypothetical protein